MSVASHILISASLLPFSFVLFPYVRHPRLYFLVWFPKALFFLSMVFKNLLDPRGLTYWGGEGRSPRLWEQSVVHSHALRKSSHQERSEKSRSQRECQLGNGFLGDPWEWRHGFCCGLTCHRNLVESEQDWRKGPGQSPFFHPLQFEFSLSLFFFF